LKLSLLITVRHSCDELSLDGSTKASTEVQAAYQHAQKMHAAMTYAFGRLKGLRTLPWHESETTGQMLGNPSVSAAVSSYMLSLRRRKVSALQSMNLLDAELKMHDDRPKLGR
jgi:hypothetical protein